jgi:hypothetical protein
LGESRQLIAEYLMSEIAKHLLVRPVFTSRGHVKGRGLAIKEISHCVVFSKREKEPKE